MLVGLQYSGNSGSLSVMLYKSYKSVNVSWDKPYKFTPRDIINDDAKKYYIRNYSPLGIKVIEDNTILPELDEAQAVSLVVEEPIESVNKVATESEAEIATDLDEIIEEVESNLASVEDIITSDSSLDKILGSIKEEYGEDTITSITESDLASLLDERLDDSQVKELAGKVGYSIGRAKNKYKIISGLASSKLDEVVKLILS